MSQRQKRRYLRRGLGLTVLSVALWVGACASAPDVRTVQPTSGPTDVDLDSGRTEAASRYRLPRQVHRYQYDQTEVDLAQPLKSLKALKPAQ